MGESSRLNGTCVQLCIRLSASSMVFPEKSMNSMSLSSLSTTY